MMIEPLVGSPVRIPPGRVAVRLDERHRVAYRRLYQRSGTTLDQQLPVLRDRDFDGRAVKMTPDQLEALNLAFASMTVGGSGVSGAARTSVFEAQEAAKTRLHKRTQYLS